MFHYSQSTHVDHLIYCSQQCQEVALLLLPFIGGDESSERLGVFPGSHRLCVAEMGVDPGLSDSRYSADLHRLVTGLHSTFVQTRKRCPLQADVALWQGPRPGNRARAQGQTSLTLMPGPLGADGHLDNHARQLRSTHPPSQGPLLSMTLSSPSALDMGGRFPKPPRRHRSSLHYDLKPLALAPGRSARSS